MGRKISMYILKNFMRKSKKPIYTNSYLSQYLMNRYLLTKKVYYLIFFQQAIKSLTSVTLILFISTINYFLPIY